MVRQECYKIENLSVDFLKDVRNTLILEIIGLKSEHKEFEYENDLVMAVGPLFSFYPSTNICHAIKSLGEQLFVLLLRPRFGDKYYK